MKIMRHGATFAVALTVLSGVLGLHWHKMLQVRRQPRRTPLICKPTGLNKPCLYWA